MLRPQKQGDPFEVEGSLWSFNYFFYNRKLKRILFFTCSSTSKVCRPAAAGRAHTCSLDRISAETLC